MNIFVFAAIDNEPAHGLAPMYILTSDDQFICHKYAALGHEEMTIPTPQGFWDELHEMAKYIHHWVPTSQIIDINGQSAPRIMGCWDNVWLCTILASHTVNLQHVWLIDVHMRQWTGPRLLQIMAYRLTLSYGLNDGS